MKFLLTALLFLPLLTFAQEKKEAIAGSITGIVKDSANDYALESVTVLI